VLVAVAVATCLLAMWTGTADTIINPLPGSGTSWGG
jgi:23S rRNA G2445 N2-methylase RlmL